jgi:hypothetical protein
MLVDIPLFIDIIVAVGITLLAIIIFFFALVVGHKQLELGEEEELILYGRKAKPKYGKY